MKSHSVDKKANKENLIQEEKLLKTEKKKK